LKNELTRSNINTTAGKQKGNQGSGKEGMQHVERTQESESIT